MFTLIFIASLFSLTNIKSNESKCQIKAVIKMKTVTSQFCVYFSLFNLVVSPHKQRYLHFASVSRF